jgi:predicted AlkP superfamily phosphohydrolase/phosphomutase
MIYVNSPARFGTTRNRPPLFTPREIDEARDEAVRALSEAQHPETGDPLFPKIIPVAETYGVDPAREGYPDLIALPDASYWVRTKLGSGRGWVSADPNLPGTHRPEGVVAVSAPGVAPGRRLHADLVDVAPTILRLLGEPIPAHVEGIAIGAPRIASAAPPAPTTNRVDPPQEPIEGPHRRPFEYSPEEQAIIEQRLADLGYLE